MKQNVFRKVNIIGTHSFELNPRLRLIGLKTCDKNLTHAEYREETFCK